MDRSFPPGCCPAERLGAAGKAQKQPRKAQVHRVWRRARAGLPAFQMPVRLASLSASRSPGPGAGVAVTAGAAGPAGLAPVGVLCSAKAEFSCSPGLQSPSTSPVGSAQGVNVGEGGAAAIAVHPDKTSPRINITTPRRGRPACLPCPTCLPWILYPPFPACPLIPSFPPFSSPSMALIPAACLRARPVFCGFGFRSRRRAAPEERSPLSALPPPAGLSAR